MKEKSSKEKSMKEKFLDRKLAFKISMVVGVLLTVCLTALIAVSASLAGNFLNTSIEGEFDGIATQNGLQVQAVIDTAENAAQIIRDYVEAKYDTKETSGYTGGAVKSGVYKDVVLQKLNKETEDFMLSIARTTVETQEEIVGVGVFFEPDAFDPAIKDYTIYVGEDDIATGNVQSYGSYENYGTQAYYKNAAQSGKECFTDPYEDQGVTMVSASFPIVYNNQTKAVILVDINIDTFSALKTTDEDYPTMYAMVLTNDGMIIFDSESDEYIGHYLSDLIAAKEYAKIQKGIDTGKSFSVLTKKADGGTAVRYYTPIDVAGQTWWALSALEQSDLMGRTVILVALMIAIAAVTLIAILMISSKLIVSFLKPIGGVVSMANRLAEGDFSVTLEVQHEDEVGELSHAFNQMTVSLREIIADIARQLKEMAENNFNLTSEVEHVGEFKEIENALAKVVADLSKTLTEINQASDMVSDNAGQLSEGAQSITEGATDQAASIEELQSTIDTVSEQVNRNAENANAANDMAKVVGEDIMISNKEMQQVVQAMDVISETSRQIGGIIATINDIASQTNLLALNASIEAARAGEEGRGFAVVANQVGTLASQSAEAAKTSNDLIAESLRAVEEGKKIVDKTAAKLVESVDKTNQLVENIGSISAASEHQAEALGQVAQAANQIAAVVEENTAMAEESSASSEELAAQAERLKSLVSAFTLLEQ